MESKLIISFPDSSKSFAHGVEFGRILQMIESGETEIDNKGFPIRIENKNLLEMTCKQHGYIPMFGKEYCGEWIEFKGLKKSSTDN